MYTHSLCRKQSQMSKQNVWTAPSHLESLKSYCRATCACIGLKHWPTYWNWLSCTLYRNSSNRTNNRRNKTTQMETGANNKGFGDWTTNKQQKRCNKFTSSKGVQQHRLPWQLWRTTLKEKGLKWKQTRVHDRGVGGSVRTYLTRVLTTQGVS